ncbi:MAG: hypothetical protein MJ110_03005 [Lachnospiraceae bacterium]|nr:hypothetical protein [Lachnospiraceae bacterium]
MRKPSYRTAQESSIELCRIFNPVATKHLKDCLINSCVSFVESYQRIPFWKRESSFGYSKVCVVTINRHEYKKARTSLADLDPYYKEKIFLNIL